MLVRVQKRCIVLARRNRDVAVWNAWSCSTYISGSFCVSRTAAMGIPKFDAGPQKSVPSSYQYSFSKPRYFLQSATKAS